MDVKRLKGFNGTTVWAYFGALTQQHKAISLGQGAPDFQPPQWVKDCLKDAADGVAHQYARDRGDIDLVKALAIDYSQSLNRPIDEMSEIMITNGATEALFCAMMSLVTDGDEVILFEPAFDIYPAQVQMAGGTSVFVSIDYDVNGKWQFDINALEQAITSKTKAIVFNSPMNPTGRMLTVNELEQISELLQKYPRIIAICDEVYEYLYYSQKHVSLASLPGMFERCVTIASSAKTYSITGWKVGWAIASKELINQMMGSQQWIVYSICTPAQKAIGKILSIAKNPYTDEDGHNYDNYYDYLRKSYTDKIRRLVGYCEEAGLKTATPDGAFYLLCDISNIAIPESYLNEVNPNGEKVSKDWAFCLFLTKEIGVSAIPTSAFFIRKESKEKASNLIRLCACKLDDTIDEAGRRLLKLKNYQK